MSEPAIIDLSTTSTNDTVENCRQLESGYVLYFDKIPFDIPNEDREFLLHTEQANSRLHKNISYRPMSGVLNGVDSNTVGRDRLQAIMKRFSQNVTGFVELVLAPYQGKYKLDYASFRPLEEEGRNLPLHRRNDLLHVDAFPTRPTKGGRILRVFANINPRDARVWNIGEPFHVFMPKLGKGVTPQFRSSLTRGLVKAAATIGLPMADRSPYDEYMLFLHHWMKEHGEFQSNCPKQELSFPPGSAWMVYTDGVPHAVMHGRYALEQTFIVLPKAFVVPEIAPVNVLERVSGRMMVDPA